MNVNQVNRWALNQWLRSVRLPLTLVERIRRRDDGGSWPPALTFEMFEGTVKDVVGRATSDDTLIELAALQRAEVVLRRRALTLGAEAAATSAETRQAADAEQAQLVQRRKDAAQRARRREAQAENNRQEAKRALDQRSATKRSTSTVVAATRAKTIDKQATKAQADRLTKDAQTLRAKQKAASAHRKVLDLDKAVDAKKATRRTG